jgi:Peptidase family M23
VTRPIRHRYAYALAGTVGLLPLGSGALTLVDDPSATPGVPAASSPDSSTAESTIASPVPEATTTTTTSPPPATSDGGEQPPTGTVPQGADPLGDTTTTTAAVEVIDDATSSTSPVSETSPDTVAPIVGDAASGETPNEHVEGAGAEGEGEGVHDELIDFEATEVRLIEFPVAGPVSYGNDFGDCRDACSRRHAGNDLIGVRLQPLVAAADGVIDHLVEGHPTAGYGIVITDAEGWQYRYYHVNNDNPGTDDAADPGLWRFAPGIAPGAPVTAGQIIGWMGDSGNSELSVPHLHFELRRPDGKAVNPYYSLRWSQRVLHCDAPLGPFASLFAPILEPSFEQEVVLRVGTGTLLIDHLGLVHPRGDAWSVGDPRFANDDGACPAPGTWILPVVLPTIEPVEPAAPGEPPLAERTILIQVAPGVRSS